MAVARDKRQAVQKRQRDSGKTVVSLRNSIHRRLKKLVGVKFSSFLSFVKQRANHNASIPLPSHPLSVIDRNRLNP
jgi:hypothetical protein